MNEVLRLDLIMASGFNAMAAFFCGIQVVILLRDGNTKDGSLLTFGGIGIINLLIWAWQIQIIRQLGSDASNANDEEGDDPWTT
jgi:hypothetical protein